MKKIKYKDLNKIDIEKYLNYFSIFFEKLLKGENIFIEKFKNTLDVNERKILDNLILHCLIQRVVEKNKRKYIQELNGKFNSKKLMNLEEEYKKSEELEKEIKKQINSVPKDKILSLLAKFFSATFDNQSKEALINLVEIKNFWDEEINKLQSSPKFKRIENKNARTKQEFSNELLKILTGGKKLEEYKSAFLESNKRLKEIGFYNISINLDEELDLQKLNYDKNKYRINTRKMPSEDDEKIIDDGQDWITLEIGNKWKSISLKEYYNKNIENFSPQVLKSKDLLDQIFAIYTIKRAQKGDEKAVNKLFECYVQKAQKEALFFFTKYGIKFSEGGNFDKSNIRSVANTLLWTLLGGDKIENLSSYLKDKCNVDRQLTRKLPSKIIKIYTALNNLGKFNFFSLCINYVFKLRKEFKRRIKNLRYNLKKSLPSNKKGSVINYLIKICEISINSSNNLETILLAFSQSLDPYMITSFSPEFNKYLYRPSKNSTLTTWLFGDKKKWKGMFWQKLNDWYKSKTEVKNKKRKIKKEDLSSPNWVVYYNKFGRRKFQSKEEFLEDFSHDEDVISLDELKELENQEPEHDW